MNVVAQRDVEKCVNRLDAAKESVRERETQIVKRVSRRGPYIQNRSRAEHLQDGLNKFFIEGLSVPFMRVHLLIICGGFGIVAALGRDRFFDNGGHAPSGAADPRRG